MEKARHTPLVAELVAALEEALPYVEDYESEHMSNIALAVSLKGRAAIAKATTPAPAAPDDGWIEWKGGECPVARDVRVDVQIRAGYSYINRRPLHWVWDWGTVDAPCQIIAYRLSPSTTSTEG